MPGVLWALLFGNFVIGTGVMVVPGTLNDISDSLLVSVPVAGQLISAGALLMCLGAPLLAAVVAGWDRRRLLALSMLWFGALQSGQLQIVVHGSQFVGQDHRRLRCVGKLVAQGCRELAEHATQPKYVYSHKWTAGDLVIWDNRTTMHRVRRFDDSKPRDMRRTTVAGTTMTVEQAKAA